MTNYYFTFDDDNATITARLVEGINDIPSNAVKVSESVWVQTMTETDGVWVRASDGDIVKTPLVDSVETKKAIQTSLLDDAAKAMGPLSMILQLGTATKAEKALAVKWQDYYRALKAVDLDADSPEWPTLPTDT